MSRSTSAVTWHDVERKLKFRSEKKKLSMMNDLRSITLPNLGFGQFWTILDCPKLGFGQFWTVLDCPKLIEQLDNFGLSKTRFGLSKTVQFKIPIGHVQNPPL